LITTQDEPGRLSSFRGVPFAGLQPVPGRAIGLAIQPLASKRMTRLAPRVLLPLELSPGQWPLTRGDPGRPPSRRGRRPGLFVDRKLCTLLLASATAPAISGATSTRPPRRPARCGFKEVATTNRVRLRGLSKPCTRTPRSWRGLPPRTVSATLEVGDFRRRRDRWFPESGLLPHTGRVHWGCGSGSPTA